MKKLLPILLLLTALSLHAQSIVVFPNDSAVGTVDITRSADQSIYFINNSSQQIEVAWVITTQTFPQQWFVTLCDDHACHTLPHPGDTTLAMMPGDTNFLHLTAAPGGVAGNMLVQVQLTNLANPQETSQVTFILEPEAVGITPASLRDRVTVSPSPANEVLYVRAHKGNLEKGRIALYDLQGKLMLTKLVTTGQVAAVDVQTLEQGIYLLRYECKSGNLTQKVMVTH